MAGTHPELLSLWSTRTWTLTLHTALRAFAPAVS
jgi:hypothetical protein